MRIGRIRGDYRAWSSATIAAAALALIVAGSFVLESVHAAPQETQPGVRGCVHQARRKRPAGPADCMFPEFSVERATVKDLIMMAYEVQDFRVTGGPGWINSDRYNIDTKSEGTPVFSQEIPESAVAQAANAAQGPVQTECPS